MKPDAPSRRRFLRLAGLTAGLSLGFPRRAWGQTKRALFVYLGTYTTKRSEGIYVCRLDLASGELQQIDVARGVVNPSFLTVDPRTRFLYAVNEVKEFGGKPSGAVSAFSIDEKTGALKFINQQRSAGSGPCHLTIDKTVKFVVVANYDGGSIGVADP